MSQRDRDSAHAGVALAPDDTIGAIRAHLSSSRRLGRYRIRSSIKLVHPATRDDWPPIFNLVEVEPSTNAHDIIMQNALLLGRSTAHVG